MPSFSASAFMLVGMQDVPRMNVDDAQQHQGLYVSANGLSETPITLGLAANGHSDSNFRNPTSVNY